MNLDRSTRRKAVGRSLALVAAVGATLAVGASAARAESVYVKIKSVTLRAEPGLAAKPVASATMGAKLDVVNRAEKGWIRVRTSDGSEGFVSEKSLNPKPINGASGGLVTSLTGGAEAGNLSESAAGRGLGQSTIDYAKQKGLSTAGVKKLERQKFTDYSEEFDQFTREGRLAPHNR